MVLPAVLRDPARHPGQARRRHRDVRLDRMLAFLPWLDTSRVRSGNYRPIFKGFFLIFAIVCVALGYLGSKPAESTYLFWARVCTFWYFFHFIVILPLLGLLESPKPLPASISDDVLSKSKNKLAPAE
jgi:ubiquinol-cytochrome c reductase cytochrome b/c1 subunit